MGGVFAGGADWSSFQVKSPSSITAEFSISVLVELDFDS